MIYLLESYLDASGSSDNDNLNINGFNSEIDDYPGNVKSGDVCVF